MNLHVIDDIRLTEIRPSDKSAFIKHLRDKGIYDNTFRVPYPYTEADADWWIKYVAEAAQRQGRPLHWAIRKNADLIGCCALDDVVLGESHRAEIGYWLARPFWGQGIMTAVVRTACELAFRELGLIKITAVIFEFNHGSARVLEHCGFELEGRLRKHYRKDEKILDALLYGRIKPESSIET